MASNTIFFAWNRSIPGREHLSASHFEEFVQYLGGLQQSGVLTSFDPIFLEHHGGDVNGFFLIRGDAAKLDDLTSSKEWRDHMLRASMHLMDSGAVRGFSGDAVMERMEAWKANIPS